MNTSSQLREETRIAVEAVAAAVVLNFAPRIPLYCINAALVESGEVTAAVVGDPSTDEIFVAERGCGASLVEAPGSLRPIAVSDASETLVIAAEAGAVVSDIDGNPWTLASDSLVASATEALHEDLLDLIHGR